MVIFTGQYWIAHSVKETSNTSMASLIKIKPVTIKVTANTKKNTEVTRSVTTLTRSGSNK